MLVTASTWSQNWRCHQVMRTQEGKKDTRICIDQLALGVRWKIGGAIKFGVGGGVRGIKERNADLHRPVFGVRWVPYHAVRAQFP